MRSFAPVHKEAARLGYVDVRAAARAAGVTTRTLTRHLRRIGYKPWLPGLWVLADTHVPYVVRCRMVLAASGTNAHLTAASALWALGILRREPDDVEVAVPATRRLRLRDGVCVHHATDYAMIAMVTVRGLRAARAPRALAEHARHTTHTPLCRAMADTTRLRHATLRQIGQELAARGNFPGRAVFRCAYGELCGELNHSGDERLARRLLRAAGVAVAPRPGPVEHRDRVVAEVDLPFYDVCYGVEIDGPAHLLPEQAARDAVRDRMLARDCRWSIDRFWWHEIEQDPDRFVREVVARLRALGSAAAPPIPHSRLPTGR